MTEECRIQLIDDLIRLMPVIWRRSKPDPSKIVRCESGQMAVSDLRILVHLALHERQGVGQIADRIGLSRPATTEAIDRLAAKSLVVREPCDVDRRRVLLTLTPVAIGIASQFIDRWRGGFERALEQLTEDEQLAFHKGMFALANSLVDDNVDVNATEALVGNLT